MEGSWKADDMQRAGRWQMVGICQVDDRWMGRWEPDGRQMAGRWPAVGRHMTGGRPA